MTTPGDPLVPPAQTESGESLPARLLRRARWAVRDLYPGRVVIRDVRGRPMSMPWAHRLPDYSRDDAPYGQNLVELARRLASSGPPLRVLDVGANIGDSALQILDAVDARVLCVEADDFYLRFLELNVGDDDRVVVEAALLEPDDASYSGAVATRAGGTTRFAPDGAAQPSDAGELRRLRVAELHERHREFAQLRLVKSDTDGYDVVLVPALARAYADARPVLFFEYDILFTREAGLDPYPVWDQLAALGYREVAIWDNGGRALIRLPIGSMEAAARELAATAGSAPPSWRSRATPYWDVAVVHGDDDEGRAAIAELVPASR